MKKAELVLGGQADEWSFSSESLLVGVDYGAYRLAKRQQPFALAIGDFDSVTAKELRLIKEWAQEVVVLPKQKDETDTEAALHFLQAEGYEQFVLHDSLGGRIDHSLANIRLAQRYAMQNMAIVLYGKKQKVTVLAQGTHPLTRNHWPYQYLSFFALTQEVTGLTLEGFQYPLEGVTLSATDIYTISNEWVADEGVVSLTSGLLLLINTEDDRE